MSSSGISFCRSAIACGRFDVSRGERLRGIAHDALTAASPIAPWKVCIPLILFTALMRSVIGLSYWLGMRAVSIYPTVTTASFAKAAVALTFVGVAKRSILYSGSLVLWMIVQLYLRKCLGLRI